jgi:GT2 family glycosyltransferase
MDLSIVIVNYNDRRHLDACLSSLQKHPPSVGHEVIVVDNASSDGSRDWIAGAFPAVRLIANPENTGFSTANNLGVRESRGEFLLFLNSDTVVPPGALDGLLAKLKSDPSFGAAGPALLRGPRSYQVSFGRSVNFGAQFWQKLVLNSYHKVRQKKGGKDRAVGWLSAACLLCRRTAFERAGGFDERFFLYFEDIDLCLRWRLDGWKMVHVPAVRVFHEGGATTAPRAAASRFEYRKSQLYFYEKHNSRVSYGLLRTYLRLNFRYLAVRGAFQGEDGARLKQRYVDLLSRKSGST